MNNAGRATPGTFATITDEQMAGDYDVKVFSIMRCTRAAVPHMRERGGGRIVNINAVYGKYPDPAFFATSVNRAAGQSLTKILAMELGRRCHPGERREHRVRGHAAVEAHPRQASARAAGGGVLPAVGRAGGAPGADSAAPTRSPGSWPSWPAERAGYITGASIDVAGGMGKYV